VDEAERHPARDKPGLRRDDRVKQAKRPLGPGVVAGDDVISQPRQRLGVLAGGEILEGADPDVAG
jgi:hypothetical protein